MTTLVYKTRLIIYNVGKGSKASLLEIKTKILREIYFYNDKSSAIGDEENRE